MTPTIEVHLTQSASNSDDRLNFEIVLVILQLNNKISCDVHFSSKGGRLYIFQFSN